MQSLFCSNQQRNALMTSLVLFVQVTGQALQSWPRALVSASVARSLPTPPIILCEEERCHKQIELYARLLRWTAGWKTESFVQCTDYSSCAINADKVDTKKKIA